MGWTYGVMGETQITASRATQDPGAWGGGVRFDKFVDEELSLTQ